MRGRGGAQQHHYASFPPHGQVILYVDLHGHSHKQNIFNYGCHDRDCDHTQFLNERVFCFLLSQLVNHMMPLLSHVIHILHLCIYPPPPSPPQAPDKFSFPSCKFSIRKSKRRTGRVIVWKMGVANSFTMEASFCGSTLRYHDDILQCSLINPPPSSPQASDQVDHFTTEDLVSMGQSLCEAIHKYHHFLNSTRYVCGIRASLDSPFLPPFFPHSLSLPLLPPSLSLHYL